MKEIKMLVRQLRGYPNNWFVYPDESVFGDKGLRICDKDGQSEGFIETGVNDGKVIID